MDETYLADGYVYNAADKTVNADTSVAAIGTTKYASLAAAIKAAGFDVERRCVYLEKPIKDLGIYQVKLNLHPEVSQTILVNVARTEDDAKKQEKAYNKE